MGMAERIKERRKAMGYTQTELGEKLGLQASAIAKYENGRVKNMKRSVIANMAKVLECSPTYLMGLDVEQVKKSSLKIMQYYELLNDIGKDEATKRIEELTHIEKYTTMLLLDAAHESTNINVTEEMLQHDEDIMNDENF